MTTHSSSSTRKSTSGTKRSRTGKYAHPGYAFADKNRVPPRKPGEHYWVLEVPYDELPRVAHHGARYIELMNPTDPINVQGWVYVGTRVPESLKPFMCARWSREHWMQQELNEIAPTEPPEPTYDMGKYVLRSDQIEKRDTLIKLWSAGGPDAVDSSSTGVGKTVTALATVKALPNVLNVLIIAPKGALPGWYQHLRDAGDGGKRWLRTSPQSLLKMLTIPKQARVKDKSQSNEARVEYGVPLVKWDVIICDEAHIRSNPLSQQSRILDKLIAHNNAFVLNLSATPAESPARLAYLHRGLAFATGNTVHARLNADAYAEWCQRAGMPVRATATGLVWDPNPDDASTMHDFLYNTTPTWAVTGSPKHWPEMQRTAVPVELTPAEMDAYNTLWDEFSSTMSMLNRRRRRAHDKGDAAEAQRLRNEARDAQIRYRQKAGILRAPHVADYVVNLVEAGYQVAVSFEFTNSTLIAAHDALTERGITPAWHTGQNVATREKERIAYQQGRTPVILFSTTSSINLHSGETAVDGNTVPRITVVADPRWSGTAQMQIDGRSQRNGTFAPIRLMYACDTIDERVVEVMLRKMATLHTLTGKDDDLVHAVAREMGIDLYDED